MEFSFWQFADFIVFFVNRDFERKRRFEMSFGPHCTFICLNSFSIAYNAITTIFSAHAIVSY